MSSCGQIGCFFFFIFHCCSPRSIHIIRLPTPGYRCEWCGVTAHSACRSYVTNECTFGILQPIYLPPHAVSIPRTEVPMEAIIGVQAKAKITPLQRDYSCRKYLPSLFASLCWPPLNCLFHTKPIYRGPELLQFIFTFTKMKSQVQKLKLRYDPVIR